MLLILFLLMLMILLPIFLPGRHERIRVVSTIMIKRSAEAALN